MLAPEPATIFVGKDGREAINWHQFKLIFIVTGPKNIPHADIMNISKKKSAQVDCYADVRDLGCARWPIKL